MYFLVIDMLWLDHYQKELEKKMLSEISKEEIHKHVMNLVQWERDSGTEDAGMACMYIKEELEEKGVSVEIHSIDAFLSQGANAELKVLCPEEKIMKNVMAHAFSGSTDESGFRGELIDAEKVMEESTNLNLDGKILLNPKINYLAAQKKGVAAILIPQKINQEVPHKSQVKHIWGAPTPEQMEYLSKIPILSITKKDSEYLKELCKRGVVRVWLRTSVRRYWDKINLPIAVIKGIKEPEKFVLVGAHYDGWWYSATDNATGVAGMMDLARVLTKNKDKLSRSVKIAFWPGHSTGTYAGSTWYADNNWQDLFDDALVFVHHDIPGKKGASLPFKARLHSELKNFLSTTVKETTGKDLQVLRWGHTGDQSFWGIGLPSFATAETYPSEVEEEMGRGDWWWHTPEDTIDKVDFDLLETTLKMDAVVILRLCNSPILPFEFDSVANDFIAELDQIQQASPDALKIYILVEKAEAFRKLLVEMEDLLKTKYENKKREEISQDVALVKINKCLMRLSRILIPVLYTSAGLFEHDPPASKITFLPLLHESMKLNKIEPESDEFKSLMVKFVRERNRISHALSEASLEIERLIDAIADR
jgi:N-acetylated-alpha-linked acidic dipeptidase